MNITNKRSSYQKIFDSIEHYKEIYKSDFQEISNLLQDHYNEYDNTMGKIQQNFIEQLNMTSTMLTTIQFMIYDTENKPTIPIDLLTNVLSTKKIAQIYWEETYKFNTTYVANSAGDMFIENPVGFCNTSFDHLITGLDSLASLISSTSFGDVFYLEVSNFLERAGPFKACTTEYINKLMTARRLMEEVNPEKLENMLLMMLNIRRDTDINELHLPLLQDQKSLEELIIAYYENRTSKLELAERLSGDMLDSIKSKIEMFFFRVGVNVMEPFSMQIIRTKFQIIDSYQKVMSILESLHGYITESKYHISFTGLYIWNRKLVTLANNLIEYHESSSSKETLGHDFALAGNNSLKQIDIVISEHVSSYYEGKFNVFCAFIFTILIIFKFL